MKRTVSFNKNLFLLVCINLILLVILLPSYGISFVTSLMGNRFLVGLELVAIITLFGKYRGIITKHQLLYLIFCVYCAAVTLININIQHLALYYWFSIVMIPFGVCFLAEDTIISEDDINQTIIIESFCSVIYASIVFLNFNSINKLVTASTGTAVYYILTLLPFVLALKNKKIKVFLVLVVSISCLLTTKRTALIALVLSLLVYFDIESRKTKINWLIRFIRILLFVCVIIAGIYLAQDIFGIEIIDRMIGLKDDGGSYRSYIYEVVWDKYKESSLLDQIFGRGFNAVRYTMDIKTGYEHIGNAVSAHNDFLEVLVDYGMVGLAMYLMIIITNVKLCFGAIKKKADLASPMAAALVIFTVLSLFSHLIIYPTYIMNLLVMWTIFRKKCQFDSLENDREV